MPRDLEQEVEELRRLLAAAEARAQAWIEYHEWVLKQCVAPLSLAIVHGWRESEEVIAEGKRRRAALGYTAPSERTAALTPPGAGE